MDKWPLVRRHHNMIAATKPPINGPIDKGGGGGSGGDGRGGGRGSGRGGGRGSGGGGTTVGGGKGRPKTGSPCPQAPLVWGVFDSWTYSTDVTSVEFTNLCRCDEIAFIYQDVTTSAAAALTLEVSVDNGASWYNSGSSPTGYYDIQTDGIRAAGGQGAASTSSAITGVRSGFMMATAMQLDTDLFGIGRQNPMMSNNPSLDLFVGLGDRVDAARLVVASGNITGGSITLLARR